MPGHKDRDGSLYKDMWTLFKKKADSLLFLPSLKNKSDNLESLLTKKYPRFQSLDAIF